jgi:hypothetical protein
MTSNYLILLVPGAGIECEFREGVKVLFKQSKIMNETLFTSKKDH